MQFLNRAVLIDDSFIDSIGCTRDVQKCIIIVPIIHIKSINSVSFDYIKKHLNTIIECKYSDFGLTNILKRLTRSTYNCVYQNVVFLLQSRVYKCVR